MLENLTQMTYMMMFVVQHSAGRFHRERSHATLAMVFSVIV